MAWNIKQTDPVPAPAAPISEKRKKTKAGWYLLPLGCFLLCFGLWLGLMALVLGIEDETSQLQRWCSDPENLVAYQSAMAQNQRNEQLKAQLAELELLQKRLDQYPRLDGAWLGEVLQAGGPGVDNRILGYHAHQGQLRLRAESQQPLEAKAYVSQLEKSGTFQSIEVTRSTYERGRYVLELRAVLQPREPQ